MPAKLRFLLSVAFLFIFTSTPAFSKTYQRTQVLMGNVPVSITIRASSQEKSFVAMESAFEEVRRIENRVSEWKVSSDTTRLNHHAGDHLWIPVGNDLMAILLQAEEISRVTQGAFDITFAGKLSFPHSSASYVDVEFIPELGLARLKKKKMRIGVSSIAKGYIVDRMGSVLRKAGYHDFLINAGDLYASGSWEIAIKSPDGSGEKRLRLHNEAISTSGLYERGNHIIDPRTGKIPHHYFSATVIQKQSMISSPLATALFVMSPEQFRKSESALKKSFGKMKVIFMNAEGFQ